MELPPAVKWTGVGLRMHADDFGRETLNARRIRAALYPLDDEMTIETLEEHMLTLDAAGYIVIYTIDSVTYYAVAEWPPVSHASPRESIFPCPPEHLLRSSGAAPEPLRAGEGESEREGASEGDGERPAGVPPSPFCKIHRPNGTRHNCRHCGTARLAQDQWIREHAPQHPETDETDWTASP